MSFRETACEIAGRFVPDHKVESYTFGREWLLDVAAALREEIETALATARREALEEAAHESSYGLTAPEVAGPMSGFCVGEAPPAWHVSARIRALIEKESK